MTLDTLGVELENRRGPRRVVPLAVAFDFRRVVLYVHPGRPGMLVHEPHHAFVRPHLGIQQSTAASHWGGAEVEEYRLSLGLRVLQDLINVMAKLDWHGMLAAGNLVNIAGPSPKTGHDPQNSTGSSAFHVQAGGVRRCASRLAVTRSMCRVLLRLWHSLNRRRGRSRRLH